MRATACASRKPRSRMLSACSISLPSRSPQQRVRSNSSTLETEARCPHPTWPIKTSSPPPKPSALRSNARLHVRRTRMIRNRSRGSLGSSLVSADELLLQTTRSKDHSERLEQARSHGPCHTVAIAQQSVNPTLVGRSMPALARSAQRVGVVRSSSWTPTPTRRVRPILQALKTDEFTRRVAPPPPRGRLKRCGARRLSLPAFRISRFQTAKASPAR